MNRVDANFMLQSGASEHAQEYAMAHASTAPEFTPFAHLHTSEDPLFGSSASSGNTAGQPFDDFSPGPAVAVGGSKRQNRARSAPASLERKLEVNRAAQKRFRQRQKAGRCYTEHLAVCSSQGPLVITFLRTDTSTAGQREGC